MQNVFKKHFYNQNVQLRKTKTIEIYQIKRIQFLYVQKFVIAFYEKRQNSKYIKCILNRDFFVKCFSVAIFRENAYVNYV